MKVSIVKYLIIVQIGEINDKPANNETLDAFYNNQIPIISETNLSKSNIFTIMFLNCQTSCADISMLLSNFNASSCTSFCIIIAVTETVFFKTHVASSIPKHIQLYILHTHKTLTDSSYLHKSQFLILDQQMAI